MKQILPLLLIVLLTACKGPVDGDIQYANFKYAQTQCADPWPNGDTDAKTAANAKHYLDSLGAFSMKVELQADNAGEICNACTCKTGKVFHAFSTENKAARFEAMGFVRE